MRAVFAGLASVLVGLAIFEITMQPRSAERFELAVIFGAMAVVMAVVAIGLPRFSRTLRSIRWTFGILSVVSFAIVVAGVFAVADRMFLSDHDLTLLLVVLGFGIVSAVGFAISVSRPLTEDLERLADIADHVAKGGVERPVSIDRHDEVGRLARSLDEMIVRLDSAQREREANVRARQAFFTSVGHDLRSPLASLQAAVEALQDGLAADPQHYLASMEREIGVLSALVEDIYLLARIESGVFELNMSTVDLTELADEAIDVLRPLAQRRSVRFQLQSPRPVMALGGPEALGRVIRNLLDNAVRHSPDGAEIVVAVGADGSPSVTVVDQGEGFAPDFIDVAFDRFTRGDPARMRDKGGSGLGLAIASGFVSALDGEMWAEPGPGGTVGFRLPAPV